MGKLPEIFGSMMMHQPNGWWNPLYRSVAQKFC